jgi:hypothetical protein
VSWNLKLDSRKRAKELLPAANKKIRLSRTQELVKNLLLFPMAIIRAQ